MNARNRGTNSSASRTDAVKHKVLVIFALGLLIGPMAAGAQQFAYVTSINSNTVSVIRTSDNAVVATVPVATGPYGVSITPDGAFAYVTSTGANTVSVIRTSTNTVVGTIAVGSGPIGIKITPDGSFAYVANSVSQTVSVIRTSDNTIVGTISVGVTPLA